MRLSEIYTSIQGEGPNTGRPTTFVRFGGCNLRCPGWGFGQLPDGSVVRGCDTVFAVYPEWRDTWESVTPEEIVNQIPDNIPAVCLTGGEPLIQPSRDINELAFLILDDGWAIDLFTNGSQHLTKHAWTVLDQVTVVMDWKLPGSGESDSFLESNLEWLKEKDAVKFVCKDRNDFEWALHHIKTVDSKLKAQVYFGVAWEHLQHATLAAWVMNEYPLGKLNIQTHKLIWDPQARRT